MEAAVARLAATSKFEVKAPDGVIGVRTGGTRFAFAADCSLSVDRGGVVLVYLNEKKSGKAGIFPLWPAPLLKALLKPVKT